jgi:cobalamin synthase
MRRLTILAVYGGYLGLVVVILALGGKQLMLPSFPAAIFAVAAWIGFGVVASHKAYWRLAHAPASDLDEREVQARLGAYWSAYALFVTIVFVGLIALTLGSDIMKIKAWDVNDVSALVWGVFLFGLTLPAAIMMWTHEIRQAEDDA